MKAEVSIKANFLLEPAKYHNKIFPYEPWLCVTLTMQVKNEQGNLLWPAVIKNYTTRSIEKFLKDWGHIEGLQEVVVAIRAGLVKKPVSLEIELTEPQLRVKHEDLY